MSEKALFVRNGVEFLEMDVPWPQVAWKVRVDGITCYCCVQVRPDASHEDIVARLVQQAKAVARARARRGADGTGAATEAQKANALKLALPLLVADRRSLVECCSDLRADPNSGEIVVVPGTLDPAAEADVAAYDEAIAACREALWEDGE